MKENNSAKIRIKSGLSKRLKIKIFIITLALIFAGYDIFVLLDNHNRDLKHKALIAKVNGLDNNSNIIIPTPKTPDNYLKNYNVPARDPKFIIIPKINVNTRVISTGINKSNEIGVPPDSIETAWYRNSSLPGNPGATFIDGHVMGWDVPGVFYNLKKLVPGDEIQIVTGNNKTFTYIVQKLIFYDHNSVDMNQALTPFNANVSGLNIMTCAGGFINKGTAFSERLVVFSNLQS